MEQLYNVFIKSSGVNTDTRSMASNQIFFALRGPNFNGNDYVQFALDKGALAVVADENNGIVSDKVFYVDDALGTLQKLANYHRKKVNIPTIGLTGSNGKTTTKELLSAVLSQKYNVLSTFGNLNNHIGVPLTLLRINKNHELAVIEMGANKIGDIEELSSIAEPTHGLITSIGKAHLEGFGSLEGVKKGKAELFRNLELNNGVIFLNSQVTILEELVNQSSNLVRFGNIGSNLFIKNIKSSNPLTFTLSYQDTLFDVESHLFGSFHQSNILYAIQIGLYFNVPIQDILKAIKMYVPNNNRSEMKVWNGNNVLLDAYNANPTSMQSAINEFYISVHGSKLLVLGDMFELGDYAQEEHQKIVDSIIEMGLDAILIGKEFNSTNSTSDKITKFLKLEDAPKYIISKQLNNHSILVKGSRSMKMETIFQ